MFRRQLSSIVYPMLFWAGLSTAQAQDAPRFPNTPLIHATGRAVQSVLPDEFTIDVSIEASAATAEQALTDLAPKVDRLLKNVKQTGIDETETKSTGPDSEVLYRHYYDDKGQELYQKREATGYRAVYKLTIKSKKMEKPGTLAPSIAAAGATIDSLFFDVTNRADIARKLGIAAVADAASRAREMILAAGGKPGRILEIDPPLDEQADLNRPARHGPVDFSFALRPGMIDLVEWHSITMEILPQ